MGWDEVGGWGGITLTQQGELIWIERLRVAGFVLTVCLSEPLQALHLNETLVCRDVLGDDRIQKKKSLPLYNTVNTHFQMQISALLRGNLHGWFDFC